MLKYLGKPTACFVTLQVLLLPFLQPQLGHLFTIIREDDVGNNKLTLLEASILPEGLIQNAHFTVTQQRFYVTEVKTHFLLYLSKKTEVVTVSPAFSISCLLEEHAIYQRTNSSHPQAES